MSTIGGKKRESNALPDFKKSVGLFEAKVIAVNPNMEEYKDILGIELKEDSKALEYLGKTDEDNIKLRIDIWLEEVKDNEKFKVTFFLEDKENLNADYRVLVNGKEMASSHSKIDTLEKATESELFMQNGNLETIDVIPMVKGSGDFMSIFIII